MGKLKLDKNLIATVDEDFAEIDRLLKQLRLRISRAAEAVHALAEEQSRNAAVASPTRRAPAKHSRAAIGRRH